MDRLRKITIISYIVQLVLFILVVSGLLPRGFSFGIAAILLGYCLLAPLEYGVLFFIASIPLCVALPITQTFDSFNIWRLASLILFLRWLFINNNLRQLYVGSTVLFKKPVIFFKNHPFIIGLGLLITISLLGLFVAREPMLIIRRLTYFINLGLIGIVIYNLTRTDKLRLRSLATALLTTLGIVVLVGYIQLISTFLIDIYQFMRIWGEGVQLNQFGQEWSYIATHVGNTWFAYYGEQLSLRVFSLFPDSHSFPIALLLCFPALLFFSIHKLPLANEPFHKLARQRMTWWSAVLPLVLLIMILSGTRGIWAAGAALIVSLPIAAFILWCLKFNRLQKNIFAYLATTLVIFAILFVVAYPIFSAPQFLLSKDNALLLEKRFRSILDFDETSNAQRVVIWRATGESIKQHPWLGVGLYNYPQILNQKSELSKAGSSAHNLYLHLAAELGLPALVISLWLLWLLLKHCFLLFRSVSDIEAAVFNGTALLSLLWVLLYSMTDVAIFDERAFLLFMVLTGIILGQRQSLTNSV